MTENPSAPPTGGAKKSGKLGQWVKKNKTLAAVIGLGGGYLLWRSTAGGGESGATEGVSGSASGPAGELAEAREESHAALDQEINRVGGELGEETTEREREDERIEAENNGQEGGEQETAPGSGEQEPNNSGNESTPETEGAGGGVHIHGKNFPGATGSRIARTGTTGSKHFIEYAITFPGRVEHWQYFAATHNWRLKNNSATGPTSGRPHPKPPKHMQPPQKKPGKKPGKPVKKPGKKPGNKPGVGPGKPAKKPGKKGGKKGKKY